MTGIMHAMVYPSQPGLAGALSAFNVANVDLRAIFIANGWDGVSPITSTYTINAGVIIYSNSVGLPALTDGAGFPAGSVITIINYGTILGKGGAGGTSYGIGTTYTAGAGNVGGPALKINSAAGIVSVNNVGTIGGGGGGGGAGGGKGFRTVAYQGFNGLTLYGGGSGGGGIGLGSPGGYVFSPSLAYTANGGADIGSAGTLLLPGNGGSTYGGGGGGGGGGMGAPGGAGGNASWFDGSLGPVGTTIYTYGGAGGAGGAAVVGNANITWIATGTRLGAIT